MGPLRGRQGLEQKNVHGQIAAENFVKNINFTRFEISRTKQNKPKKHDQTYQEQNSEN